MERTVIQFFLTGLMIGLIRGEVTKLDEVVKRLEAIEDKLSKVDALFDSFDQLCKSLDMIKTEVKGQTVGTPATKQDEQISITHMQGTPKTDTREHEISIYPNKNSNVEGPAKPLKMISVTSSGYVNEAITVTVIFMAGDGYIGEWFLSRREGQQTRSIGQVDKDVDKDNYIRYTLTQTLRDVDILHSVSLMVNSDAYNAFVDFNITALNVNETQNFKEFEYGILEYSRNVIVPGEALETKGFNTTVVVSENVIAAMNEDKNFLELSMSIFNSSVVPAAYVNIWAGRYEGKVLSVAVKNGSTNEILITLDKSHAKFGGIMTLRIPQKVGGFMNRFEYGVEIKVINEDNGDVMPRGTFGLYQSPGLEYIRGPYVSVYCIAYGIPLPSLTMFKKDKNGALTELNPNYEIDHGIYYFKVLKFDPTEPTKQATGTYVCQASNGVDTIDNEMTYETMQRVEIDEDKTRLAKNNTKKTVVTCKATGNPTPDLELRADSEYGRNLLQESDKQFKHTFSTRKHVNKATLVISPPDESISVIYCVARQDTFYHAFRESKAIRIREFNPDLNNDVFNSTFVMGYSSYP